jgi:hypothetical protein
MNPGRSDSPRSEEKRLEDHALRVASKFTPLKAGPLHLKRKRVERVILNALPV